MIYQIEYTEKAETEIAELKKSDIPAYKKLVGLIKELHEHPRVGTEKPELMKYGRLKDLWSRRITDKHRLVYSIDDSKIVVSVISAKSHYGDK